MNDCLFGFRKGPGGTTFDAKAVPPENPRPSFLRNLIQRHGEAGHALGNKILHLGPEPEQITHDSAYSVSALNANLGEYMPYMLYIKSARDSNQWYTIEYRDNRDMYETDLPSSGLIIGRWMDTVKLDIQHSGNAFFDFYNMPNTYWVFRPDSDIDTVNGLPGQCVFDPDEGRTEFGPNSNPHPFTADGTPERFFRIFNINKYGTFCMFSVEFLNESESIDEQAGGSVAGGLRLCPNPARNTVAVELPQGIASAGDARVTVLDAVGHEVMRLPATGERCQLDVGSLSAGVYFVTLTSHQGVATQKLIIQ